MTQVSTSQPDEAVALEHDAQASWVKARLSDYVELSKLRITLMVAITTAIGFMLAVRWLGADWTWLTLLGCLAGTSLACMGASALNQSFEQVTDALMPRTRQRPIAAGRVGVVEGLWLGLVLSTAGVVVLGWTTTLLAAALAVLTIFSYAMIYTPMKRLTSLSTLVGAVPGAMPPMIGYAAVNGTLEVPAWLVFAIMFLWQLPHFLAIAWLYREDYAKARMPMLPVLDPTGRSTFRQMLLTCAMLLPLGMLPTAVGVAGWVYFTIATAAGAGFMATAVMLVLSPSRKRARLVFFASLLYLPLVLAALTLDPA